jgi:hypothetical protein
MMLRAYCINDDDTSSGRSMTLSLFPEAAASASRALARRAISASETKEDDVEDGS